MNREEIKKLLKEKDIDRRALAEKLNVSPSHLGAMLNGWSPLKEFYEKEIEKEVSK